MFYHLGRIPPGGGPMGNIVMRRAVEELLAIPRNMMYRIDARYSKEMKRGIGFGVKPVVKREGRLSRLKR
jgi:hypothetical protein